MSILKYVNQLIRQRTPLTRCFATGEKGKSSNDQNFETVFKFPFIKYLSLFNRLKVYQIFGTSVAIPACGLLEIMDVVPHQTFLTTAYVGISSGIILSLATLPLKNIIGFLYINENNSQIKISVLDYWGRRKDRIVPTDDWIPLYEMEPKQMDLIYLTPKLADGTNYKLFIKFGDVCNQKKMSILE